MPGSCVFLLVVVKTRQKHFFLKTNFRIGTEHLVLFGRLVFSDVFLVFQAFGTFKLFVCFQHKSRSATPDTFRDSAKTFSDIAIYASVSNFVFGQ